MFPAADEGRASSVRAGVSRGETTSRVRGRQARDDGRREQ